MSNEKEDTPVKFTLLELNHALSRIDELVAEHKAGKIDEEELLKGVQAVKPHMEDFGIAFNDTEKGEEPGSILNTKPVPEQWDSAIYFYVDDDGKPQATIRVNRFGENYSPDSEEKIRGAEAIATDIVRMVHNELNNHLMTAMFEDDIKAMIGEADPEAAKAMAEADKATADAELETLLEGIDDEFTIARIRRDYANGNMTRH